MVTEDFCFICERLTDHRGEHDAEEEAQAKEDEAREDDRLFSLYWGDPRPTHLSADPGIFARITNRRF